MKPLSSFRRNRFEKTIPAVVAILFCSNFCCRSVDGFMEMIARCSEVIKTQPAGQARSACIDSLASVLQLMDPLDTPAGLIRDIFATLKQEDWTPLSLSVRGHDLMRRNMAPQAAEVYLDLILRFPRNESINRWRIALARAFRDSGKFDQAREQLASVSEGDPPDSEWAKLETARLYQAADDNIQAERVYRSILAGSSSPSVREIARAELQKVLLKQMAH